MPRAYGPGPTKPLSRVRGAPNAPPERAGLDRGGRMRTALDRWWPSGRLLLAVAAAAADELAGDDGGVDVLQDDLARDEHAGGVGVARDLVHDVLEDFLH